MTTTNETPPSLLHDWAPADPNDIETQHHGRQCRACGFRSGTAALMPCLGPRGARMREQVYLEGRRAQKRATLSLIAEGLSKALDGADRG